MADEIKFTLHRQHTPRGFAQKWSFAKSDIYCPNCGKQDCWEDTGGGDYYVGATFACMSCKTTFHVPDYGNEWKKDNFYAPIYTSLMLLIKEKEGG